MTDIEERLRTTLHRRAQDPTPSADAWQRITAGGPRRGRAARPALLAAVIITLAAVPVMLRFLEQPTVELDTLALPPPVADVPVETLQWHTVDHEFAHPDGPVRLTAVAAHGEGVVVTGSVTLPTSDRNDAYHSVPLMWSSPDAGLTWEGPWMAADLIEGEVDARGEAAVAATRDGFRLAVVVMEDDASAIGSVVLRSDDGFDWSDTEESPTVLVTHLESTDRGLIATGGDPTDPERGGVAVSENGTTWSSEGVIWPEGASVHLVAAGPGGMIAGGFTQPVVHHSADGRDWDAIPLDDDRLGQIEAVTRGAEGFVLVASTSERSLHEAEPAPAPPGNLLVGRSADGREWDLEALEAGDSAGASDVLVVPGGSVIVGVRAHIDGVQPVAWVRNRTGRWHVRPFDVPGADSAELAAVTASGHGGIIAVGSTRAPTGPTLVPETEEPADDAPGLPPTQGRVWLGQPPG